MKLVLLSLFATDPVATWTANTLSEVRVVGLGVVGIGILVVGIRFICAGFLGSEHQNVLAKSGLIVLIVGAVMIIASSAVLAALYNIAGVQQ